MGGRDIMRWLFVLGVCRERFECGGDMGLSWESVGTRLGETWR